VCIISYFMFQAVIFTSSNVIIHLNLFFTIFYIWSLCAPESISPTFYWRNCANILAQIKSLTFTASTKTLRAKLSYEKGARKMLVKLTPGRSLSSRSYSTILLIGNFLILPKNKQYVLRRECSHAFMLMS
jgi:hypothetical protein